MRSRLPVSFILLLLLVCHGFCQPASVQLKIKESSGFLGLGGPRIVEFRLASQEQAGPLNSVNVNAGPFVYFECSPLGSWQLDESFVSDYLSNVAVVQNGVALSVGYTGEIRTQGDTTSILLGYPKTLRVTQPFLVRFPSAKGMSEVEFKVPMEYWPGYDQLAALVSNADNAVASKQYRTAIATYNEIIANGAFRIFPQQEESKISLMKTFDAYVNDNVFALSAIKDSARLNLKEMIARVGGYRPTFMYVIDSLPQVSFDNVPLDSSVAQVRNRAKAAILQIGSMTDSLQNILDEQTVRWILDGSVTGRRGLQYQEMIQALAYAYASLDFADTSATQLQPAVPSPFQARLAKDSVLESFQTFVRICSDRRQMHLALFPVDFLPNLRKDSAAFSLPFYSMLKAVNDYYAGNDTSCRNEIAAIFRTCYVDDLLRRFDNMRVIIHWRQNHVPPDVFRLIREGGELEQKKDLKSAEDKYRQAMIIAPDFAYSSCILGEFYGRSGDSVRAVSSFQKAYQLDTLYLSAYNDCSKLYQRRGDYKAMAEVLTLALARGNDYWITNFSLGQAFMGNGDPVSAIARFARALELNSRSYETYIAVGKACQASKDYQRARDYFNKAIEIDALRQEAVDALNRLNEQQMNVH